MSQNSDTTERPTQVPDTQPRTIEWKSVLQYVVSTALLAAGLSLTIPPIPSVQEHVVESRIQFFKIAIWPLLLFSAGDVLLMVSLEERKTFAASLRYSLPRAIIFAIYVSLLREAVILQRICP